MAWAAGRLLFQAMSDVGPGASRAGVLRALADIRQFDSNGLVAGTDPGSDAPSPCLLVTRIRSKRLTRLHPASGFHCGGREIRS